MKKLLIEGINGKMELNKNYIYLILSYMDKPSEEHIIWFDEIEDVVYKKPTRFNYGFISLYLSTKSYITKRKIVYKIILDKIDEKSIESNKKLYIFIKGIIENKKVEVYEEVEQESLEEQEVEKPKEIKIDVIEEIKSISEKKKEQASKKEEIKEEIPSIKPPIISYEEEKVKKEIHDSDIVIEEQEKKNYVKVDIKSIEEIDSDEYEDTLEEQEELEEEKKPKTIKVLEDKTRELEKELQKISYKEIILSEYIDNTYDKKKIDKLIIELKKIIEKIEKIKKDISRHEKIISGDKEIKIENGNVIILSMDKSLLDETELNKYIEAYKSIVSSLERVEKDKDELAKSSEQRKKDIGVSDDEYERKINQFKGVKDNKEFISKLIKGIKEDLSNVKWKIEKTVEPSVKYKFVRKELSKQTKMLAGVTALNAIRPNRSRFSMVALSVLSGARALHELLGFDIKKVEYNEIVQKEFLEGLEYVDTDKARALIDSSKEEIDSILLECEKKYGNYPQFNSLKKNLISLKKDIEDQDKELRELEDKVKDYYVGPKMKVLRYNQE